jgi:hypothetical protein
MSNNDTSFYTLRWNGILGDLEYISGLTWLSTGVMAGGGITQLTGPVTAGPGTGSQPTTITATGVTPGSYTSTNLTVNAAGQITAASNGSGGGAATPNVVQFVQGSFDTIISTTYTPTSMTLTITPSHVTSKIKLSLSAGILCPTAGDVLYARIYRNGVALVDHPGILGENGNPAGSFSSTVYIDSPATTGGTVYTVYAEGSSGNTMYIGNPSGQVSAFLIAEEIFS